MSGRSILFVPTASAAGLVLIEYTISDGNGGEDIGKVLVVVLPGNQENGPPVAAPDEISAPSRTLVFDPTKNDKDPDNDPLTLVSVTQPNDGGTTAKLSGNQVSFTPVVNRTGTFRFSYVITDGMGHEATGQRRGHDPARCVAPMARPRRTTRPRRWSTGRSPSTSWATIRILLAISCSSTACRTASTAPAR